MIRRYCFKFVTFCMCVFVPLMAYAASLTLQWDPVTTDVDGTPISNLAGYHLFQSNRSLLGMTTQQATFDSSITKMAILSPAISTVTFVSYSVTDLREGATYFFRLTAYNTSGIESEFNVSDTGADEEVSAFTPVLPDTTAPSVPANLTAAAVSSTQINLSWNASTDNIGVTGYRIYRGGVQVTTSTVTSYSDTGLTPSTTYSYKVSAYDAAGNESSQSAQAQAVTPVQLDTAPPTGSVSINNGAVKTSTTSVTLTLIATDSENGMGQGAQMQFSNDNVTWSTPEAYTTTKSWILTSGNGTKTVYVKFKDASGNWSNAVSDTIKLNISSPSRPRRLHLSL